MLTWIISKPTRSIGSCKNRKPRKEKEKKDKVYIENLEEQGDNQMLTVWLGLVPKKAYSIWIAKSKTTYKALRGLMTVPP